MSSGEETVAVSPVFGRFTLEAIPITSLSWSRPSRWPSAASGLLGALTYFRVWNNLALDGSPKRVDHKRIGVMYIVLALVISAAGAADLHKIAGGNRYGERHKTHSAGSGLRTGTHHAPTRIFFGAWRHHDLLRGDALRHRL